MSTYFTIRGSLEYPNQAALDKVVAYLQNAGWMDEERFFVNENDERVPSDFDPHVSGLCLNIPWSHYRNLARGAVGDRASWGSCDLEGPMTVLFQEGVGKVCWTSTDGIFAGGVITGDGVTAKETSYDLEKWWADQGEDGEETPDVDGDFDAYVQWQAEVESAFLEANGD
jgi:hypothetical protein